jgi:hypothetical protein
MGSTLGNLVFELGEKAAAKIAPRLSPGVWEDANKWISKTFSLNSQLTGESGEALKDYLKKYEAVRDHHISLEDKVNSALPQSQQLAPWQVRGKGQMAARNKMFGPKDELMQGFVGAIAREHGEEKAKNIVDALGVYFHDTAHQQGTGEASRLSSNLKSKNSVVQDIKFRNSPYKPSGELERKISATTTAALAFKAGLAHTTTPLNALIGRSLTSFGKATRDIFGSNYEGSKAQLLALDAIGQLFNEEHQQIYNFQNGIIHQYAPGSIGKFISDNWMIPGMSAVRMRTGVMLAMQGKYAAQELFERMSSQNIKVAERAKFDLKRLGLDPAKLAAQKGLLPDDIRTAMFNNTNDRMFLNTGLNRSQAATSTTVGRLIGMYHNYGAGQANFIQKELVAAIQKKDPMSFVKTVAILGTVFPAVGAAVHGLEDLWMGKGIDRAKEDLKEGIGVGEAFSLSSRLDAFAHTAGFGVLNSYTRSIGRNRLAESMLGPSINSSVELVQDAYKAEEGLRQGKDVGKGENDVKTYAPLLRDLLHDVPSLGVGAVLSEKLFPTKATLDKRKPMTIKKLRRQRAAELSKLKKKAMKGE